MRLSEQEADLIRASFRSVTADSRRAAEAFYRHLFAIDPAARGLFVADMSRQGVKLTSTLGMIVAQIHEWEMLVPLVEDLALRHLAYGVRPEHYAAVGAALGAMFEELLEAEFTPEHAAAWARAFSGLQTVMIAAAYPAAEADADASM